MKKYTESKKTQKVAVQWLIRIGFIWAIHLIAFLIGGLLIGSHIAIQIVLGVFLIVMIYFFIFFISKNDGDKDYAISASNKKTYYNDLPLSKKLLQFNYWKGTVISLIALFPVIIIHIIALISRFMVLKGLVSFFYIGVTLLFSGAKVFDNTAQITGSNFTAYALIFTFAIIISVIIYSLGYIWGGHKRIMFRNQIEKEQIKKNRDW